MSLALAIQQVMLAPNYGPYHTKSAIKEPTCGMTKHRRDHADNFAKVFAAIGIEATVDTMLDIYRADGHEIDRCMARKICEQMVEENTLKRRKATVGGRPRVFYSLTVTP